MSPPGALVKQGLSRARPLAIAVGLSARNAQRDAGISVVDSGDPARTARLAEILGAPIRTPAPTDLMVLAPPAGAGLGRVAERLAEHRRRGGEVQVVVAGSAAQRRRTLRTLAETDDVGISTSIVVEDLGDAAAERIRLAVVQRLGTFAVPAAREAPGIRDTATRNMVRGAAKRGALVAAAPTSAPTGPVLTLMQARLVSDVTALGGARPGPREAGAAAGIAATAPLWRATARSISRVVPRAAWAARAGVAYGVTRGLGELANRVRPRHDTPHASEEDT